MKFNPFSKMKELYQGGEFGWKHGGWTSEGDDGAPQGYMCLDSALSFTLSNISELPSSDMSPVSAKDMLVNAIRNEFEIPKAGGGAGNLQSSIIEFNDKTSRTKEDIMAVLERAESDYDRAYGDGEGFGRVATDEQVRAWIDSGRANAAMSEFESAKQGNVVRPEYLVPDEVTQA